MCRVQVSPPPLECWLYYCSCVLLCNNCVYLLRLHGKIYNFRTFIMERSVFLSLRRPHDTTNFLLCTRLKGPIGRPLRSPKLLRLRARAKTAFSYVKRLTSTNVMNRLPALASYLVPKCGNQRYSIMFKTSSGAAFYHDLLSPQLFGFAFFNTHWMFPRFVSLSASHLIGFLHVNTKLRYIRDFMQLAPTYSRSSGSESLIVAKDIYQSRLIIRLPSGRSKFFFVLSQAIRIPRPSSPDYQYFSYSTLHKHRTRQNAGYSRRQGWRPTVRGIAKNPVDHPHGGRAKSIRLPLTPWGLVAKKKS